MRESILSEPDSDIAAALMLVFNKVLDHSTRLSHWHPSWAKPEQLFYNQAFNTFLNYGVRAFLLLDSILSEDYRRPALIAAEKSLEVVPASEVKSTSDLYVTDPPYADAINYHEITEFFIAWNRKNAPRAFADWTWSSRRSLAIKGKGVDFRRDMIAAYRAMAEHMPDNGMQVVMFTHQDPAVWADVGMILWAAGLRVTAAWCITTEVEKVVTVGNNVQGTVLLVLRKRKNSTNGWSDDVLNEVEDQVKEQLDSMLDLDNEGGTGGVRNFSDADYQLAAYAAALRVITGYATIDNKDVGAELLRERKKGERTEIQALIERAVEVANNYLVPDGVAKTLWSQLEREARFYLKMVDVESKGDRQLSAYAEFARGFGLADHKRLLGSDKANEARLRWAADWKGRDLGESEFGRSLVRHVLFGVWKVMQTEQTKDSIAYLRREVPDYWHKRQSLSEIARYLAEKRTVGKTKECDASALLAGALLTDRM
jgi:putative DNA methylase